MYIAKTATSTLEQGNQLTILHDIAKKLSGLGIVCYSTAWYINNLTFTIGTRTLVDTTILAVTGKDVALVFEVQQCPIVAVSAQDDVTTLTTVATIGTTIGNIFCTMQVSHSAASAT
jgi:hypothetical protein